jgi:D-sedoheptulose 7-phosphate isomerase
VTAYANDESFDDIFKRQLENFISSKDIFIGLSVSGNSRNIISALTYAKIVGAKTIAFLGITGGKAKNLADISIISGNSFEVSEDTHMIICHFLVSLLKGNAE